MGLATIAPLVTMKLGGYNFHGAAIMGKFFNEVNSSLILLFSYNGYLFDTRAFHPQFVLKTVSYVDVMRECEIECNGDASCRSYNYSPYYKQCQLLATDAALKGTTGEQCKYK